VNISAEHDAVGPIAFDHLIRRALAI